MVDHARLGFRRRVLALCAVAVIGLSSAQANEVVLPSTVDLVLAADVIVVGVVGMETSDGRAVVVVREYLRGRGGHRLEAENELLGLLNFDRRLPIGKHGIIFLSHASGKTSGLGFAPMPELDDVKTAIAIMRDPLPHLDASRWRKDRTLADILGQLFEAKAPTSPEAPLLVRSYLSGRVWIPWHQRLHVTVPLVVRRDVTPFLVGGDGTAIGDSMARVLSRHRPSGLPDRFSVVIDTTPVRSVGGVSYARAVGALTRMLAAPRVRGAAAEALLRLRAIDAVPAVIRALPDARDSLDDARALVRFLGASRDARAARPLAELLGQPAWQHVSVDAATALECIGDQSVLPIVRARGGYHRLLAVLGTDADLDALMERRATEPSPPLGWFHLVRTRSGQALEPWMTVPDGEGDEIDGRPWLAWWQRVRDLTRNRPPLTPELTGLVDQLASCSLPLYYRGHDR